MTTGDLRAALALMDIMLPDKADRAALVKLVSDNYAMIKAEKQKKDNIEGAASSSQTDMATHQEEFEAETEEQVVDKTESSDKGVGRK